jgi:hypothetical protein
MGGSVSEMIFENGLCMPSGSNLSDADRERITTAINLDFETALLPILDLLSNESSILFLCACGKHLKFFI